LTSRGSVIVVALFLLTLSCRNAAREGEIACQRRLVAATDDVIVPAGPSGEPPLAARFAATSRGFEQMPVEGCSEDQRDRARMMARVARDLSTMAAKIGDPLTQAASDLQSGGVYAGFQVRIELFESRRRILRVDLDRMMRPPA
jgi:hypothetical protein